MAHSSRTLENWLRYLLQVVDNLSLILVRSNRSKFSFEIGPAKKHTKSLKHASEEVHIKVKFKVLDLRA